MREHRNQPFPARYWLVPLCLSGVAAGQDGGAQVIDRTVATFTCERLDEGAPRTEEERQRASRKLDGSRVITLSQLEFESRVTLVNAGGVEAAFAPLDQQVLERSLEAVIDQRLAVCEADQLDAYTLEEGELEKAVIAFRSRFADEGRFRVFLEQHEATLDDLRVVLRRALRAQRALDGKLRLKALVSEGEAARYQSEHPELKGLGVEVVRQKLFVERFNGLVRAELKRARRTADVRLLGPFAPVPKGSR